VDAQWLEEFDARLADYRATLTGTAVTGAGPTKATEEEGK
jgi:hypothetical protein